MQSEQVLEVNNWHCFARVYLLNVVLNVPPAAGLRVCHFITQPSETGTSGVHHLRFQHSSVKIIQSQGEQEKSNLNKDIHQST